LQPVVAFAGEHCHPSFYSTGHGAYLSGRSAAQYFMAVASAAAMAREDEEEVYNLVKFFVFLGNSEFINTCLLQGRFFGFGIQAEGNTLCPR
jgi:hypothetical protein